MILYVFRCILLIFPCQFWFSQTMVNDQLSLDYVAREIHIQVRVGIGSMPLGSNQDDRYINITMFFAGVGGGNLYIYTSISVILGGRARAFDVEGTPLTAMSKSRHTANLPESTKGNGCKKCKGSRIF